ncbi:MAG: Smr/MutS family protein [Acidobacteriota bacterium]
MTRRDGDEPRHPHPGFDTERAKGNPDDPLAGEPVELEITDTLDLHSFPPREIAALVRDYLDAAYERGLRSLRIVHGRGIGVQRNTVRTLLERDPRVVEYGDAPADAGGWGATRVRLQ